MAKQIEVRAARTQTDVENHECGYVRECDTISEAKWWAKNSLTDDFQRSGEMSEPFQYSQVVVDGQCHSDFFRAGYNGEVQS